MAAWIAIVAGTTRHLTTGMIHFLPALYALKLGASPPLLSNYMLVAATIAVFGVGQGLFAVLGTVIIADAEYVAAEERGLANGLRLTTMRVGAVAGPVLFGPLTGLFVVGVAFAVIVGASVAVALFLSWSGVLTRVRLPSY